MDEDLFILLLLIMLLDDIEIREVEEVEYNISANGISAGVEPARTVKMLN